VKHDPSGATVRKLLPRTLRRSVFREVMWDKNDPGHGRARDLGRQIVGSIGRGVQVILFMGRASVRKHVPQGMIRIPMPLVAAAPMPTAGSTTQA